MWLPNVDGEALIITHKGDYNHIYTGFPVNANLPSWQIDIKPLLTSFLYFRSVLI